MIAQIIVLPYKNFKEKISLVREHESEYHIEDISETESVRGFLYMERRTREVVESAL